MPPRRLLIKFAERVAIEALILQLRRPTPPATLLLALAIGSLVAVPVLYGLWIMWLLTGRGPGLRIAKWGLGGPRQRPSR
jgi:hypothetical protein